MHSLMTLLARAERHDADIKELREQTEKLSGTLRQLAADGQRDREAVEHARRMAKKDNELLLMRLETKLVEYERPLHLNVLLDRNALGPT